MSTMNLPNFKKIRIILAIITIFLSATGFLYARSVLSEDIIEVEDKEAPKDADDIKPVRVTLIVKTLQNEQSYQRRMQNNNTVSDLLREIRETEDFTFERIAYTYGTELDYINGVKTPDGYSWRMYMTADIEKINETFEDLNLSPEETDVLSLAQQSRVDITYKIDNTPLVGGAVYELILEPSSQNN